MVCCKELGVGYYRDISFGGITGALGVGVGTGFVNSASPGLPSQ